MNIAKFLNQREPFFSATRLLERADMPYTESEYVKRAARVLRDTKPEVFDQLKQLLENPTEDGDIISPTMRNELVSMRCAHRICVNMREGFTAATYKGLALYLAYKEIQDEPSTKA